MKTADTINSICAELGITKSDLAKRMGMLPSSLYRKLARESMTFEELQRCLDVLGVVIRFELEYPDGTVKNSQVRQDLLLQKMDMLQKELEASRKASEFHRKSLRDLRAELSSAAGYAELGQRHSTRAAQYLGKVRYILGNMEQMITYALGEAANEDATPIDEASIESLAGKRVLVVEDNELNREMLREILMDHDLEVEEACNGQEAVTSVQTHEPGYYHYILMDIEMPEMDGYEATMKIRRLPNRIRANIPIIALTVNAVNENREKAAFAGMDGFLVKPVDSTRLLWNLAKFQ
ncbi:MAG: response regulator [Aristaeellaceae bacterium]